MTPHANAAEPNLAPPGAGIPLPARLFLRWVINPFFAGKEDPTASRDRSDRLHEKIERAYLEIPEALRTIRVLVPPQRGLEDSSRYWSAAMVLEHVDIVGRGIAAIVVGLSRGEAISGEVDTALVKPVGQADAASALARFRALRKELPDILRGEVRDLDAPGTHAHPWFGRFTARKWHWLIGIHAGIHLRQLRAIRDGLGKD